MSNAALSITDRLTRKPDFKIACDLTLGFAIGNLLCGCTIFQVIIRSMCFMGGIYSLYYLAFLYNFWKEILKK